MDKSALETTVRGFFVQAINQLQKAVFDLAHGDLDAASAAILTAGDQLHSAWGAIQVAVRDKS